MIGNKGMYKASKHRVDIHTYLNGKIFKDTRVECTRGEKWTIKSYF